MATSRTWDQSLFERTLREYVKVSSRTLQVITNTKAWFIARKATWFSVSADKTKVKTGLGQIVTVNRLSKSGKKVVKAKVLGPLRKGASGAPLAALIVQKREAAAGRRSPFYRRTRQAGAALMTKLITKMINARIRSIAFLKSGWLPAIRKLGPLADQKGKPQVDRDARQRGRDKGDAKPAKSGFRPVAEIINLATALRDTKGALVRYCSRGFQRAIDDETRSMNEYIEKKMAPDAKKFNARQQGVFSA